MAQIIVFVPNGMSIDQQRKVMYAMKQSFNDTLNWKNSQTGACVREYRPEDSENGKISCVVYTTVGKSDDIKEKLATLFHNNCVEALGDKNLETFVVYEEHTRSNVCRFGRLASLIE